MGGEEGEELAVPPILRAVFLFCERKKNRKSATFALVDFPFSSSHWDRRENALGAGGKKSFRIISKTGKIWESVFSPPPPPFFSFPPISPTFAFLFPSVDRDVF